VAGLIPAEAEVFRSRLPEVVGLYAGGSLALGDYRPGVSDLDLVAVVPSVLDAGRQRDLERLHQQLVADVPAAVRLHCVYVARPLVEQVEREHPTWASGELYPRPLGGIARAELHRHGLVLAGPPVAEVFPPVTSADLRTAVRLELSGYWTRAVGRRKAWLQDVYVDLGPLVLARAEVALTEDRLITKAEALTRLDRFGVPARLVDEMTRRRAREAVPVPTGWRVRRARLVRRIVARGLETLLAAHPG
jgi:Nucleotidyltransferase domain